MKEKILDYRFILGLGIGLLIVSYIAAILVDLFNVWNFRDGLSELTVPLLWDLLFRERGPVEMLQWAFLGGLTVSSAYLAGILHENDRDREMMFWLLFSIAGVLMLMEDAGNIRHFVLRENIVLGWVVMNTLETLYFGLLAGIPAYAVLRYGRDISRNQITVILLGLGFVFYGSAVFLSGPADLTDFNRNLGSTVYETTIYFSGEDLRSYYNEIDQALKEIYGEGFMDVRYRFVDHLIEESLELLGATMLFASAVSYLEFARNAYTEERVETK